MSGQLAPAPREQTVVRSAVSEMLFAMPLLRSGVVRQLGVVRVVVDEPDLGGGHWP